MPHIALPIDLPGISSAMAFRPETAVHLRALAETLLRAPNSLTSAEREAIAAFVSLRNSCTFCYLSHRAASAHHSGGDYEFVDTVTSGEGPAPVSEKLRALLVIAGRVQESGKQVTADDVAHARTAGATDVEIHDTVLIAAAFCMYNRYVDGLATLTPPDPGAYDAMGKRMATMGYMAISPAQRQSEAPQAR